MTEVGGSLKELEVIVQGKTNNVRVIEQGTPSTIHLSQRVMLSLANFIYHISDKAEDGCQPAVDQQGHSNMQSLLFRLCLSMEAWARRLQELPIRAHGLPSTSPGIYVTLLYLHSTTCLGLGFHLTGGFAPTTVAMPHGTVV